MLKMFLVFSAIALTLSSATPRGLSTNARRYESFSHPKQKVVTSRDHVQVLAKGSPYSSSPTTALPEPHALIQCGVKNMTLRISKRGSSPLHVNQDGSWVKVFQKLPQCSSTMSRHRRSLWPPHYGCDISKKDGQTFPVQVAGTPLVIGCPFPPRSPPVDCTAGLLLRLGGISVVDLKIKVTGYWYPLMAVCRWCALSVELRGGELSLKAPFRGACTETKDGVHTISLQSKDAEMAFSCSPPPPTYPPYPFGHAHLPWLNVPHVHPPAVKPPFPWPILPPAPKPVLPWQTIPFHAHPTRPTIPTAYPWPGVPSPVFPWPGVPTPPPVFPWPGVPTPPPVFPWPGVPTPPPVYPWPIPPAPAPVYPWPIPPAPAPAPVYPWPIPPAPAPVYPWPIAPAPTWQVMPHPALVPSFHYVKKPDVTPDDEQMIVHGASKNGDRR